MNGTDEGTVREQSAETFLDLLGDAKRPTTTVCSSI